MYIVWCIILFLFLSIFSCEGRLCFPSLCLHEENTTRDPIEIELNACNVVFGRVNGNLGRHEESNLMRRSSSLLKSMSFLALCGHLLLLNSLLPLTIEQTLCIDCNGVCFGATSNRKGKLFIFPVTLVSSGTKCCWQSLTPDAYSESLNM